MGAMDASRSPLMLMRVATQPAVAATVAMSPVTANMLPTGNLKSIVMVRPKKPTACMPRNKG